MSDPKRRSPISARHAFGLAFDLAVRRDPVHSLLVPLALRAPWALTLALLPPVETSPDPSLVLGVASIALVGDFVTLLVISAMLRMRARAAFHLPPEAPLVPVSSCYAKGMARIPSLLLTEVLRNVLLGVAASMSILPAAVLRL